ncbi:MAG: S1 RNA-binding domain-containing protein [Bacteroidota bacterium]
MKLEEACKHISAQERKAVTAERESIKYKQTEFMLDNVGEEFDGIINGLADFGVFVELTENYVEGMISYADMDEPYDIGSGKLSITGRKTGKTLKMGDQLRVRIEDVDLERRRIDMALVKVLKINGTPEKAAGGSSRSRKGAGRSSAGAKKGSRKSSASKSKSRGAAPARKQRSPRKRK